MHPAPLPAGGVIYLRKGLPEAQGAVSNGQCRRSAEPSMLEVKEQLCPGQLALSESARKGEEFLFPVFGSTNDHQKTLPVFHANIAVDTVSPDVDIMKGDVGSKTTCNL